MSLTIGFSHPGAVTIGGKTAATINAMNQAEADASEEALGVEKSKATRSEPVDLRKKPARRVALTAAIA